MEKHKTTTVSIPLEGIILNRYPLLGLGDPWRLKTVFVKICFRLPRR